jgi:hypothetical protein
LYYVFTTSTLAEMCNKLPTTLQAMDGIRGVGAIKLQKYGERFIEVITKYLRQQEEEGPGGGGGGGGKANPSSPPPPSSSTVPTTSKFFSNNQEKSNPHPTAGQPPPPARRQYLEDSSDDDILVMSADPPSAPAPRKRATPMTSTNTSTKPGLAAVYPQKKLKLTEVQGVHKKL